MSAAPLPEPWATPFQLGCSIFPVELKGKRATHNWKPYQTDKAPLDRVKQWALKPSNIGIATGAISGIVVLDLDSVEAEAEARQRGLPPTVTVRTAKGLHAYFRHPGGTIGNRTRLLPGTDIRGDGGYVVAPGSVHETGFVYTWENSPDLFGLADMPQWLTELISKPELPEPAPPLVTPSNAYGDKALDDELGLLRRAANGTRNHQLNRSAFAIAQLAAGGSIDGDKAKALLRSTASIIGLDSDEIDATITSAWGAGIAEPRGPADYPLPNLEAMRPCDAPPNASRFRLLNSAAVAALPPVEWAVQGIFPEEGIGAIFGPVASGKSFLALLLAECFADGTPFFDRRVKRRMVIYLGLEGEGGFQRRIKVIEINRGGPLPDTFRLVLQSFRLNVAQDVRDLAEAISELGEGAVIFVDTVNRAAPDIDENSSKDMGLVIEGAKQLQSLTNGLVILVHHVGKDASKGLRGHSSLIAALDGAIEIKRNGEARSWTIAKSKDGEDGGDHGFKLRPIYIGQDEDGELVGSCVVEPCGSEIRARDLNTPTGGNQKLALDALRPLLCEAGAQGLSLATAIDGAARNLVCDDKRRPERARAAIETLASKGILRVQDGQLWLA